MTKAPLEPLCSLLTKIEMVTELERLAITYPRTDMDPRKWKALFETFWEDCRHLTLEQLRDLCRAYRTNATNRFFPTPGQLLDALPHYAFEDVYRVPEREYHRTLPEPEVAKQDFEWRCTELRDLAKQLSTPPKREPGEIVMTPELEQREKELAELRRLNLERRLKLRAQEDETGRYLGLNA